jgi:hypothetical protein
MAALGIKLKAQLVLLQERRQNEELSTQVTD